jgi:hypothetical protein
MYLCLYVLKKPTVDALKVRQVEGTGLGIERQLVSAGRYERPLQQFEPLLSDGTDEIAKNARIGVEVGIAAVGPIFPHG